MHKTIIIKTLGSKFYIFGFAIPNLHFKVLKLSLLSIHYTNIFIIAIIELKCTFLIFKIFNNVKIHIIMNIVSLASLYLDKIHNTYHFVTIRKRNLLTKNESIIFLRMKYIHICQSKIIILLYICTKLSFHYVQNYHFTMYKKGIHMNTDRNKPHSCKQY
jgi:hypothetical protein